jgi:hypothetical protein
VLLLSFGEGMKRSFHRNSRGMGEGIGVLWPGATDARLRGPALRSRDLRSRTRTRSSWARAIPEITGYQPRIFEARARWPAGRRR